MRQYPYQANGVADDARQSAFGLLNTCLTEMCCATGTQSYRGALVTADKVLAEISCASNGCEEDGLEPYVEDVFKGGETPYYYFGDGTLEAFVRIGNESVKASATELKRLVLRGRNTSYDSQMTPYRVEDYAFSKLRERYKKWTGNSFDNKDLVSFGLADEGGFLTNAGALIADESPIRW